MKRTEESQNVKLNGNSPRGGASCPADEPTGTVDLVPVDVPARRNGRSGPNGLDVKRARAVALMLEGRPVKEVAATLKVHRGTVHRWRADPEFEHELSLRRDEFVQKTFGLQVYASTLAVHKLTELLDSHDERVALRAAQTLAMLERSYVLMDQERRIRRLEDNFPFLSERAY